MRALTVCVHSHDEVGSHGLGLPQLVGVAVMDHVIAGTKRGENRSEGLHPASLPPPSEDDKMSRD